MSRSWNKQTINFVGGLNANPDLNSSLGEALVLSNYELDSKGNPRRIEGIERFDGQPSPSSFEVASSIDDDDFYAQLYAGIAAARTPINAVPGSGPVRGVSFYKDTLYAWRDNAAGTFTNVYQSSPTGWVAATGTPIDTLSTGGRVRTIKANFIGSSSGTKIFGADGKNNAFMYDGTTYTAITTATPTDTPNHVIEFQNYLWLAFTGGSLQHSVVGDPSNFGSGAGEIGIGDEIVGLGKPPGGALLVASKGRMDLIYGASAASFQRKDFNEETGAFENTLQIAGDAIIGNHQGFMSLPRTADFGDFQYNTISEKIEPILNFAENKPVASCVVGEKNQYRVFFENGEGYSATLKGNKLLGWSPFNYGVSRAAYCVTKGYDSKQAERVFLGSIDGFVYELDKGRSIDGDIIESAFRMAFAAIAGPSNVFRLHKAVIEADAVDRSLIAFTPDLDYSSDDTPASEAQELEVLGGGGYYGGASYNRTKWGLPYRQQIDVYLDGSAPNVSVLFHSLSDKELPHTLRSITFYFTMHGRKQ